MVLIFLSAFNAQNTLPNTLESIIQQDFKEWEAWLIDDASQDNTWQILTEFAKKDVRFKVWKNEQNLGLTKSLNKLWEFFYALPQNLQENIKYVARFDADDVMYPDKIRIQVDFLENNPSVSLVGALADCENPQRADFYQNLPTSPQIINVHLLFSNPIIHSNAVIRVSDWQKYIRFYDADYKLGQDFEAWTRMLQNGLTIQNIPKKIIHFTDLPTRITNVKHDILTESFYKIRKKNLKILFGIDASAQMLDFCHGLASVYPHHTDIDFFENLEKFLTLILQKNRENILFNQNLENTQDKKISLHKIVFDEHILFLYFQERFQKYMAGNTKLGYKFGLFFRNSIFSPYKNFSFFQKIKFWIKILLLHNK